MKHAKTGWHFLCGESPLPEGIYHFTNEPSTHRFNLTPIQSRQTADRTPLADMREILQRGYGIKANNRSIISLEQPCCCSQKDNQAIHFRQ